MVVVRNVCANIWFRHCRAVGSVVLDPDEEFLFNFRIQRQMASACFGRFQAVSEHLSNTGMTALERVLSGVHRNREAQLAGRDIAHIIGPMAPTSENPQIGVTPKESRVHGMLAETRDKGVETNRGSGCSVVRDTFDRP
jgi:hypothetical protein